MTYGNLGAYKEFLYQSDMLALAPHLFPPLCRVVNVTTGNNTLTNYVHTAGKPFIFGIRGSDRDGNWKKVFYDDMLIYVTTTVLFGDQCVQSSLSGSVDPPAPNANFSTANFRPLSAGQYKVRTTHATVFRV